MRSCIALSLPGGGGGDNTDPPDEVLVKRREKESYLHNVLCSYGFKVHLLE